MVEIWQNLMKKIRKEELPGQINVGQFFEEFAKLMKKERYQLESYKFEKAGKNEIIQNKK